VLKLIWLSCITKLCWPTQLILNGKAMDPYFPLGGVIWIHGNVIPVQLRNDSAIWAKHSSADWNFITCLVDPEN
jgi:hypothetical protein